MPAKTGKGYEKHRNRFRVKVTKADGSRGYWSFETEREAADYVATQASPAWRAYRESIRTGSVLGLTEGRAEPTIVEYARDIFAARDLKRNTREMYANAIRRIEQEPLGSMGVSTATPRDIREFFTAVQKNRANVKAVLGMTFTSARREGLIRISPMEGAAVKLPKRRQKNIQAMTANEVERVSAAATTDRDRLAIKLGGFAGLRAGEVGGLRVEDIDVKKCRIHVRRNAQRYLKGDGESSSFSFDTPKSESSERTVEVDCALTEDVRAYIEAHPPLADGTIFSTSYGNPVTDQVLTYNLVRACKAAGIRRATFHDLRHAYATNLAVNGLPMPVLQRVMGWSSIRMTDTYAYLQDDALGAAADITARLRREGNAS